MREGYPQMTQMRADEEGYPQKTQMGADKEGFLRMDAGVVGGLRDGIRRVAGKAWMPALAGVTGET